jgi:radical SAM superfamily enzyme YgiQ (UPF0313 family)
MKIDVLLIFPKPEYFDFAEGFRELPQSLLAISDPCLRNGFSVKIIDQRVNPNWKDEIAPILQSKPICVGLSTRTGPQLIHTIETARWIKQQFPQQKIVVGGPHVSMLSEQVVSSPYVDVAVPYEGEVTFVELVRAIADGGDLHTVQGILYKKNGTVIRTPDRPNIDINSIDPLPYHLVNLSDYTSAAITGKKAITFFPDRGCPHKCSFCNVNEYYSEKKIRLMKAENLFRHLKAIHNLGVNIVSIGDSNFTSSRRRMEKLAKFLEKENLGLKIKCSARIDDINGMDDSLLKKLKNVGFFAFQIGIESGSDRVLELMNKKITVADVLSADEKLRRADLIPLYSFMGGVPGETLGDGQKTLDLMVHIADSNPQARMTHMQLFRLFPGKTKFWEIAEKEYGITMPNELEKSFDLYPVGHPWLTTKELSSFKKWERISYFLDKKSVIEYYPKFWTKLLVPLYARIIKWRIRRRFYHFMPELKIIEWLGG